MSRLRSGEGGFAVVTAVVLMTFMLTSGVVLSSLVDAQTRASAKQRQRETAMNTGEVTLNSQAFLVAQTWPDQPVEAYPACTPATAAAHGTRFCPSPAQVAGSSPTPDAVGLAWATRVADNVVPCAAAPCPPAEVASSFFSDATHAGAPAWDANGDGAVWVRAEATAQGRTRRMVVLVRRQFVQEELFRAPVLTNSIEFRNSGNNKTFINTGDKGKVYVRCRVETSGSLPCLGKARKPGDSPDAIRQEFATHVDDPRYEEGYTKPKAMDPAALQRIKETAMSIGRFYTDCSQLTTLTGAVTWLEGPLDCKFTGGGVYGSEAEPGFLVINGGKLELRGTFEHWGPMYAPNPMDLTYTPIDFNGNVTVHGGVLADGNANVLIGSAGATPYATVQFNESAFDGVRSLSSASMVQGSWRELPPPGATG